MRLLFDENLSPALALALTDVYPGSSHVHRVGLGSANDREIWQFARDQAYLLVSKDSDFHELSLLFGCPPKVVWIKRGNCSTHGIEVLLREARQQLLALERDPEAGFLILL